jgi:hypothetical protein
LGERISTEPEPTFVTIQHPIEPFDPRLDPELLPFIPRQGPATPPDHADSGDEPPASDTENEEFRPDGVDSLISQTKSEDSSLEGETVAVGRPRRQNMRPPKVLEYDRLGHPSIYQLQKVGGFCFNLDRGWTEADLRPSSDGWEIFCPEDLRRDWKSDGYGFMGLWGSLGTT